MVGRTDWFFYTVTVIFKHALPLDGKHAKYSFFYNALIHFGNAEFPVGKSNGHFFIR